LQGAALTSGGLSSVYPDIQVYSLLLKFNNLDEIDYVRGKMDQQLMQGLEANGIVTLGFAEIGLAYLMSIIPIHNIDDMRNQKAWVPDDNYVALAALEALSVSPIPLPIRDVLMGLQTGMINVVAGSPIGALALQWHTKVEYALDLPLSYIFGVFAMNKKDFNKISEADQKIVREIMTGVAKQVDTQNRQDNIKAMTALKNQGIEFIKATLEATEELRDLIANANEKLKKSGNLTVQTVEALDKHLADYRTQQAPE
jgi:TRAP-type C4-dicarboxylate transport system substrate-binding protein